MLGPIGPTTALTGATGAHPGGIDALDTTVRSNNSLAYTTPVWTYHHYGAACGGNPWGGQFLGTFRYLDQLGRLARQEVDVVIHNTLVASD